MDSRVMQSIDASWALNPFYEIGGRMKLSGQTNPLLPAHYVRWKAIGAAFLCLIAASVAGQPNQASRPKNHSAQTQILHAAITLSNNAEANADSNHHNVNPPRWYAALRGPEGWLVVVGILTCIIIAWQAIETRRAAQVAQVSAKALITSERAWVVINEISPPPELISQSNPGPLMTMWIA